MDDKTFWTIIGRFDWKKLGNDDAVIKPGVEALAKLQAEDIFAFEEIMAEKLHALDTEAHARSIGDDAYTGEDAFFSVDEFLYARCVAIVNGPGYFAKVLRDPKKLAKNSEFEAVLYVAQKAYEKKTGKPWKHSAKTSYETFANREGWKHKKPKRRR
jgi:hypothetical protein